MSYEVIESRPVNKGSGVLSDETIKLMGYYSTRKYPDTLRLVVYEDFEAGKAYRFLTTDFAMEDPLTSAELYRERWKNELFFKRIKQHLHIKTFYGTTQNAVYSPIWIAVFDCSSLRRSDIVWFHTFIQSLTRSAGASLTRRTSVILIISRQFALLFRRRYLSGNLHCGNISPDSRVFLLVPPKGDLIKGGFKIGYNKVCDEKLILMRNPRIIELGFQKSNKIVII